MIRRFSKRFSKTTHGLASTKRPKGLLFLSLFLLTSLDGDPAVLVRLGHSHEVRHPVDDDADVGVFADGDDRVLGGRAGARAAHPEGQNGQQDPSRHWKSFLGQNLSLIHI